MKMVQINNVLVFQVMGLDGVKRNNHKVEKGDYTLVISPGGWNTKFESKKKIIINPNDDLGHAYCMEYPDKYEATQAANVFITLVDMVNNIPDLDVKVIM
jgi:hypothetical protein